MVRQTMVRTMPWWTIASAISLIISGKFTRSVLANVTGMCWSGNVC